VLPLHYERGFEPRLAGWIFNNAELILKLGGNGEIRTHGPLSGSSVFKTDAIGHSATFPTEWSGTGDSNSYLKLGRLRHNPYTSPAKNFSTLLITLYAMCNGEFSNLVSDEGFELSLFFVPNEVP
jgi:hypothetical protein